jgi:hypothetical protein
MEMKLAWMRIMSCVCISALGVQADAVWNERFNETSINDHLGINVSAYGAVTQTGGQFQMNITTNSSFQRAKVVMSKGQNGETEFNGAALYDFTEHQVSARFDIASFTGSPSAGENYNVFHTGIGELNAFASVTNGVKIDLAKRNDGSSDYYRFELAGFGTTINPSLNGQPAAFEFDLDRTNLTLRVEGTTFTTGSDTYFWTFNAGEAASYQLMFGAFNNGTPLTGTQVALDSLKVSAFDVSAPIIPPDYEIGVAAASGSSQIANNMFIDDSQWPTGISNCNWYLYRATVTHPDKVDDANYIHPPDLVAWSGRNNKGINMVFNAPTSTLNNDGSRPRDLGLDIVIHMKRIYDAGGEINRLTLDSSGFGPLLLDRYDGSKTVTGDPGGLTLDETMDRMVDLWQTVHRSYPDVSIGLYFNVGMWDWNHEADAGPWYPGDSSEWTDRSGCSFEQCVTALHEALKAAGRKIGFIDIDMGYGRYLKTEVSPAHHAYPHALDYKAYARSVQAWCNSRDVECFITIFPGALTGSNQLYYESLMNWVNDLKNDEIYPDAFNINNWTPWPDVNLPESTAYTFANAVKEVSKTIKFRNNTVYSQVVNPVIAIPGQAANENPASGTAGVALNTPLEWSWGDNAISMKVYLGTNNPPLPKDQQIGLTHVDPATGRTAFDPGLLAPDTTYYWRVDSVNNHPVHPETAGPVWSFTTQAAGTNIFFVPSDDVKVSSANASANFEGLQNLEALDKGSSVVLESYLKFLLSGLDHVRFAKLRLYPVDSLTGQIVPLINELSLYDCDNNSWSEGSVTWNSKPLPDLATLTPLDRAFPISGGGFYEFDITTAVTGLVNGAGTFSFALGTGEHSSLLLASSENSNVELLPVLMVVDDGSVQEWIAWQSAHFTGEEIANGLADADRDPDGDGFTNQQEFILGTDPRDPSSTLVLGMGNAANGADLNFDSVTGRSYSVLVRTNLIHGTWTPFTNLTGTGVAISVKDTNNWPNVYYRVEAQRP